MKLYYNSFWTFQLLGWLFFLLIQTLSFGLQGHAIAKSLALSAITSVIGLVITTLLRQIYLSRPFQSLSAYKVFLFGVLTCLLATFVMELLVIIGLKKASIGSVGSILDLLQNEILTHYFQLLPLLFIWTLLYYTIKYFRRFSVSELEMLRLQASLKEAELNTLKGQINPHFMFNSLNNIKALMLEDVDAAREGIISLAEVLRYSLSDIQKNKVPLEIELSIVNSFIVLAKLHYEDKLKVNIDISEQCRACTIPVMALQMMVENAIKHGIAEQPKGGELKITARLEAENLILQVTNPGQLVKEGGNIKSDESTGTGVRNITQRIALIYGANAKFELQQLHNEVISTLSLPKELEI